MLYKVKAAVCSESTQTECNHNVKGKGKAIPLQVWADSKCSRRLRFPDFKKIGT
jgi:hypothetical protein